MKHFNKIILAFALLLMPTFLFAGCKYYWIDNKTDYGNSGKPIEASSVSMAKNEETVVLNKTITLRASVFPTGSADKSITWSSSDETKATVDEQGVVTALKVGQVTITATSHNGKTDTCLVTIIGNSFAMKWNSDGYYIITGIGEETGKDLVFPATYNDGIHGEANVSEIANEAFYLNHDIESMFVPATIKRIGDKAFFYAMNLHHIQFADNSQLEEIGVRAFSKCLGLEVLEIPDSIKTIGEYAFEICENLVSFSSAEISFTNLKTIPEGIFYNCKNLKWIYSFTHIETISANVIKGCEELPSFTIPETVTKIEVDALANCKSLKTIYYNATQAVATNFTNNTCSDLAGFKVVVGANVKVIPEKFMYLGYEVENNFSTIEFLDNNGVTALKEIKTEAFKDCTKLKTITIPNTVTTFGESAFSGSYLTTVNIPDACKTLSKYLFYKCSRLDSITFTNNVTLETIDIAVFYGCTGLTTITLPSTVTEISNAVFESCKNLQTINLPQSLTKIGYFAFSNCSKLTKITIPKNVVFIGENAFKGCTYLHRIYLEDLTSRYRFGSGIAIYRFSEYSEPDIRELFRINEAYTLTKLTD